MDTGALQPGLGTPMALLTLAAIGLSAIVIVKFFERYSRQRQSQLREACRLLRRHFAAAGRIMKSDGISSELKHYVLAFSHSVTDERFAKSTARVIESRVELELPKALERQFTRVRDELEALSDRCPDVAANFVEMVATGFCAMTLRWPATARAVNMLGKERDVKHSIEASKTIAKADPERFQRLERGELLPA